jgi:hypothetical protein
MERAGPKGIAGARVNRHHLTMVSHGMRLWSGGEGGGPHAYGLSRRPLAVPDMRQSVYAGRTAVIR